MSLYKNVLEINFDLLLTKKQLFMKTKILLGILSLCILSISCDDDDETVIDDMMAEDMMDDDMMDDDMMDDDMMDDDMMTSMFFVNFENLEDAPNGQTYEAWLVVNTERVSIGTFTLSDMPNTFVVDSEMLESAAGFMVSVEPMMDTDAGQSDIVIMSGPFEGDTAMVTTNMQIGDFSFASGTFFLRSPTDETAMTGNNGNDQYGILFGDIDQGMPPVANFMLPELDPDRWIYEGWVMVDGTPISTGRFNAFDMQDDFNGFSAMMSSGPNLPGEDFFNNPPMGIDFPLDVRNRMVVISVEPAVDDDPAPFVVKPLAALAGMMLASNQDFALNMAGIPTATATR